MTRVDKMPGNLFVPGCDPGADGELQRDVVREVLEGGGVLRPLLPLLQQTDLVPLPRQLHPLLGEERLRVRMGSTLSKTQTMYSNILGRANVSLCRTVKYVAPSRTVLVIVEELILTCEQRRGFPMSRRILHHSTRVSLRVLSRGNDSRMQTMKSVSPSKSARSMLE